VPDVHAAPIGAHPLGAHIDIDVHRPEQQSVSAAQCWPSLVHVGPASACAVPSTRPIGSISTDSLHATASAMQQPPIVRAMR
jgi:hypothetical protein